MTDDELTREQIHDRVAWLKAEARKGAERLHANEAPDKRHQPTPTEELARARAAADRSQS